MDESMLHVNPHLLYFVFLLCETYKILINRTLRPDQDLRGIAGNFPITSVFEPSLPPNFVVAVQIKSLTLWFSKIEILNQVSGIKRIVFSKRTEIQKPARRRCAIRRFISSRNRPRRFDSGTDKAATAQHPARRPNRFCRGPEKPTCFRPKIPRSSGGTNRTGFVR